jgi:hypothetical protein
MSPLDTVNIETFRDRLSETFRVTGSGQSLELTLMEVQDLGDGYSRRAFSLLFAGPPAPVMPQAIYRVENAVAGTLEFFLVPLGPENGVFRYEAAFN